MTVCYAPVLGLRVIFFDLRSKEHLPVDVTSRGTLDSQFAGSTRQARDALLTSDLNVVAAHERGGEIKRVGFTRCWILPIVVPSATIYEAIRPY